MGGVLLDFKDLHCNMYGDQHEVVDSAPWHKKILLKALSRKDLTHKVVSVLINIQSPI